MSSTDEYVFNKLEIASFLRDANGFYMSFITNPSFSCLRAFAASQNALGNPERITPEYYVDMLKVSQFYAFVRYFGAIKDSVFSRFADFLIEDQIKIDIPENIFVNPADKNRFSKKQIINFIRNAISHNDKNKDLYKIIKTDKDLVVEVKLENTKPIPFHVRLNILDYCNIMSALVDTNRIDFAVMKLNDHMKKANDFPYKLIKYYPQKSLKTLSDSEIEELRALVKSKKNFSALSKTKLFTENFEAHELPLYPSQETELKTELESWFQSWIRNGRLPADNPKDQELWKYIAKKTYVLPLMRATDYKSLIITLGESFLNDKNLTAHELMEEAYSNETLPAEKKWRMLDCDYTSKLLHSLACGYVFDTLVDEPFVIFNGYKRYSSSSIRDSFVHSRFSIGENNIILRDYPSEDFEYAPPTSIPFNEAFNLGELTIWCSKYIEQKSKKLGIKLFEGTNYTRQYSDDSEDE